MTVTEKFSTSNASIVAKSPGSLVHGNYPGFATESERHQSLPRNMRSFRLPELHFKNSSRFHANLRAREAWNVICGNISWLEFGLEFKGFELGVSDLGNEYLTLRDNANTSNDVAGLSTSPISQERA